MNIYFKVKKLTTFNIKYIKLLHRMKKLCYTNSVNKLRLD